MSEDLPPFTHAYLEEQGNGRLGQEEKLLRAELERLGIPVTLYTAKRMQRRQLPLNETCLVAGDMVAMHGAMRQLGIEPPVPNDYPECLRSYLRRKVWTSTLAAVERGVYEGDGEPVFAKPAERRKSFTGRVVSSPNDLYVIGGTSRREQVWCSEVVEWATEYRVYVVGETILAMDWYAGEPWMKLDRAVVESAIADYRRSGTAPAAYGIDFGVLGSGETALIEANDGYALGAYQIDAPSYAAVVFTRWRELLGTIKTGMRNTV